MKKVRIGLVGAGGIANIHLRSYAKLDNVEIAAICDINPERLKETADRFNIERRYNSEEEMLANETLDAADVCVWNCNHAKCSIDALNAGLHVFCEKPMAYSAKEAEEMIEVAKKNDRLLMIGFVLRFDVETIVTKDFIDNGYLGDIYYSKATYLRRHGAPGGWFTDKARSGGGPVIDLGVHVIDLTRYLMGNPKPVSVFAATSDCIGNRKVKSGVEWRPKDAKEDEVYDVEDFAVALIRYEGNKTTLLETSYNLHGENKGTKELYGSKGGVVLGDGQPKIYSVYNDYLADITPHTRKKNGVFDGFDDEMAHFVDCVANGTPCMAPAEDGLQIMRILDAIYESARTGHEVLL